MDPMIIFFRQLKRTQFATKKRRDQKGATTPNVKNSTLKLPRHVPEDAVWASMHVQGKECVAGHIVGNVFYVVFLDKEHDFFPTELKHT
jgi:hypothetical protein